MVSPSRFVALCLISLCLFLSPESGADAAKKKQKKKSQKKKKNISPPPLEVMMSSPDAPPPASSRIPRRPVPHGSVELASPPPADESNCPDGAASILAATNSYRATHNAPALVWDSALAASAKTWSNTLSANMCGGGLYHSGIASTGENLWMGSFSGSGSPWPPSPLPYSCASAVTAWYNEVKDYKFTATPWTDNAATFGSIGHFTQLVWASTTSMGCYWSQSVAAGSMCMVVTCQYKAQGNIANDAYFSANVKPNKGSPSPPLPPPKPSPPLSPPPASVGASPSNCPDGDGIPLSLHNSNRAKHINTPALAWSSTLQASAKAWADTLTANVCAGGIRLSGTPGVGENLWMGSFSGTVTPWPPATLPYSCTSVISKWYNEVSSYKSTATPWTDNMATFGSIAHFTQMVWASTTNVGCYWSQSVAPGKMCMAVVCHYTTQGNMASNAQFLANVQNKVV